VRCRFEIRLGGFGDSDSEAEAEDTDEDYSISYIDTDNKSGDEYLEENDDDYLKEDDDDYSQSDNDYSQSADYSVQNVSGEAADYGDYDESSPTKSHNASHKAAAERASDKKPSKRKMALKKQRTWIKAQKRERKSDKRKRRRQSINGMRKGREGTYANGGRKPGRDGDNRSRATRLGIRKKLGGRDYGRNAGKEVFWRKTKKFFRGPRRRFALRGKARDNVRMQKAARG
jgi:hypothetical protein